MRFTISAVNLHTALSAVAPAASDDETRPHLNGVHVILTDALAIHVEATDGHMLARYRLLTGDYSNDHSGGERGVIVPIDAVTALIKALRPFTGKRSVTAEVVLDLDARTATFPGGSVTWVQSKGLQFPPADQVIPARLDLGDISCPLRGIAAHLLATAAQCVTAAMKPGGKQASMLFQTPDEPLDPIRIDTTDDRLTVVIMPFRIEAVGGWKSAEGARAKKAAAAKKGESKAA
jgi:hypothetical protein